MDRRTDRQTETDRWTDGQRGEEFGDKLVKVELFAKAYWRGPRSQEVGLEGN